MATAKKKKGAPKLTLPPLKKYKLVDNRLLIVDWASLSYHQVHSIVSHTNRAKYGLLSAEGELELWRNKMFGKMMDYIKLFNPMHVIFCLEGTKTWRKDFVKDYYTKHATVYYDRTTFFVESDNYTYRVVKTPDGFACNRVPVKEYPSFKGLTHKQLGEFKKEKQDVLWGIYTASGTPILPSYKGQRGSREWKLLIDRNYWREYKDQFGVELAPYFRAKAVRCMRAEGDDMIYASAMKYAGSHDDVIIITGDSDMSQIDHPKIKIFNHRTENFVNCKYPRQYLDAKVLAGDSSDNINGMAFVDYRTGKRKPEESNQIGEGTAIRLMEACPNVYEVAVNNGWDDQYLRNRKLIDLSQVPPDVKREIDAALDIPEPTFPREDRLGGWNITEMQVNRFNQMRTIGFYALLPVRMVNHDLTLLMQSIGQSDAAEDKQVHAYAPASVTDDMESFGTAFNTKDFDFGGSEFDDLEVEF